MGYDLTNLPNYNNVTLKIDMRGMHDEAKGMAEAIQVVEDALGTVLDTMDGLKLAWGGRTASEAQEFSGRWHSCMKQLFGTKQAPDGVLVDLQFAVRMASINYDLTEVDIIKMFTQLHDALSNVTADPPDDLTRPLRQLDIQSTDPNTNVVNPAVPPVPPRH